MLKKFAAWFILFGLSFLVSDVFGWAEQGKAFFYIHLGTGVVLILGLIAVLLIGETIGEFIEVKGVSLLIALTTIGVIALTLFATWGATKLFGVDFFVAYQIMTFGQCLYPTKDLKSN